MMDEYERAANEYVEVIASIPAYLYATEIDPDSPDKECRSIQGISTHVISAGFGYANGIRRAFGAEEAKSGKMVIEQSAIADAMHEMLDYTDETLAGHWSMTDDEVNKMMVPMRWKDRYDLETLLEHAIVHVLRHRRQVERLTQHVSGRN